MEAFQFIEEPRPGCSHCKRNEHKIDVEGRKFRHNGEEASYQICRGCCSMIRYFNFHKDVDKIQSFWQTVWINIDVADPVAYNENAELSVETNNK